MEVPDIVVASAGSLAPIGLGAWLLHKKWKSVVGCVSVTALVVAFLAVRLAYNADYQGQQYMAGVFFSAFWIAVAAVRFEKR